MLSVGLTCFALQWWDVTTWDWDNGQDQHWPWWSSLISSKLSNLCPSSSVQQHPTCMKLVHQPTSDLTSAQQLMLRLLDRSLDSVSLEQNKKSRQGDRSCGVKVIVANVVRSPGQERRQTQSGLSNKHLRCFWVTYRARGCLYLDFVHFHLILSEQKISKAEEM